MAIVAAEAGAEAAEHVVARSEEVRARKLAVYDYEKVFWNSVWSVGLFGLFYVSVQLGKFIVGVQQFGQAMQNVFARPWKPEDYVIQYDWCDPEGKYFDLELTYERWIDVYPEDADKPEKVMIMLNILKKQREPGEWEKMKAAAEATFGSSDPAKVQATSGVATINILFQIDGALNQVGPMVPPVIVGLHSALELARVNRERRRVK